MNRGNTINDDVNTADVFNNCVASIFMKENLEKTPNPKQMFMADKSDELKESDKIFQ